MKTDRREQRKKSLFYCEIRAGNEMMKSEPFPLIDSTEMVPFISVTIRFVIHKPRPVPWIASVSRFLTR